MKDSPEEIADVMNLILPNDNQLPPKDDFIEQYLTMESENVYTIKKGMLEQLENFFIGRVSFLKAMRSQVKKVFKGKKMGLLKHFVVNPTTMSDFQTENYINAVALDNEGKKGVETNSRQASLFVFPDGSYGTSYTVIGTDSKGNPIKKEDDTKGFYGWINKKSKTTGSILTKDKKTKIVYTLSPKLKNFLIADTEDLKTLKDKNQQIIKNISKFSSKYASVLKDIISSENKKKSGFVYCEFIVGSGIIIFSLLLELLGFSKASGREKDDKTQRYALLTSETTTPAQISRIINRFNQPDNLHGEIIKIIIGSRLIGEGFSFKNIQLEYILSPWWNYSEISQVIARGYRLGSFNDLLMAGETPILNITQCVSIPNNNKYKSIDLTMYEISEDKDISIHHIIRILMRLAFDCSLTYYRNHEQEVKDNSRECDYTYCDYTCYNSDMEKVKNGLDKDELDYSTYQLYYLNQKIPGIRKILDKLFRDNNNLDMKSILDFFKNDPTSDYTEWEINNAIKKISDKKELNYHNYSIAYSNTVTKQIIFKLEQIFNKIFHIQLTDIVKQLDYTEFEIITTLRHIINNSIIIKNKYGFSSYLREEYNNYYLVDNLSVSNDFFSSYYTKYPNITEYENFEKIRDILDQKFLPNIIETICEIKTQKDFSELIKTLDPNVQEMFIESSIIAKNQDIKKNINFRNMVLDYFKSYIKTIGNTIISTRLLDDQNILKCLDSKTNTWSNCPNIYKKQLSEQKEKVETELENNLYYGKFNPEKNNLFCIVNVKEQQKKQQMDETPESTDHRDKYPGKVCTSWGVSELLTIIVDLKLDYKTGEYTSSQINKLIAVYPNFNNLKEEDKQRLLYWYKPRQKKQLCKDLEEYFKDNNLYISDNQCGVREKKKGKQEEKKKKTVIIRTDIFKPIEDTEKFGEHKKILRDILCDCLFDKNCELKNYMRYKWVIIYLRSKILGFLIVNDDNSIMHICISKNYKKQKDLVKEAITMAIKKICDKQKIEITINNSIRKYKILIKRYQSYGFKLFRKDNTKTLLEFLC